MITFPIGAHHKSPMRGLNKLTIPKYPRDSRHAHPDSNKRRIENKSRLLYFDYFHVDGIARSSEWVVGESARLRGTCLRLFLLLCTYFAMSPTS